MQVDRSDKEIEEVVEATSFQVMSKYASDVGLTRKGNVLVYCVFADDKILLFRAVTYSKLNRKIDYNTLQNKPSHFGKSLPFYVC